MALATTTIEEVRWIGQRLGLQLPDAQFDKRRWDEAMKIAGNEFVRRTKCTRTSNTSLSLTVDSAELTYSSVSDLHPSRILRFELLYPGGSAWADSTTYAINTLVTQSNKLYVCQAVHTGPGDASTSPATDTTNWSVVYTDVATTLDIEDYDEVQYSLNVNNQNIYNPGNPVTKVADFGNYARVGFRHSDTRAIFNFVPDTAWRCRIIYYAPFTEWLAGSIGGHSSSVEYFVGDVVSHSSNAYEAHTKHTNNTPLGTKWNLLGSVSTYVVIDNTDTLNIPDDMIKGVALWGATAYYDFATPSKSNNFAARFEQHILSCAGQVWDNSPVVTKDAEYE